MSIPLIEKITFYIVILSRPLIKWAKTFRLRQHAYKLFCYIQDLDNILTHRDNPDKLYADETRPGYSRKRHYSPDPAASRADQYHHTVRSADCARHGD